MATRDVPQFDGIPDLTPEKVGKIKNWLSSAYADEDVATEPMDNAYYEGKAEAYLHVLNLLYNEGKKR